MARFILYARRALDTDPVTEDQFAPLRAWALAAGHDVVAEYADENIETRAARDPRPYLDRAIFDTLRGAADGIAAGRDFWSAHAGNRLCTSCTEKARELVDESAPEPKACPASRNRLSSPLTRRAGRRLRG
ncbi:hypothetical protein NOF55_11190 [Rhizobiaceae bacterium BDR2-2]|uniref:Uncharacterized protein n=1 Tax=Ectorhizobium quercum TaxID=2965071 RepID=A0AAE3N315_9HYPH|nr:hypothetical protein [Ectorhizobium quercum]MCX8997667.1 hypothetical protein [Ectorhizobium quercum]